MRRRRRPPGCSLPTISLAFECGEVLGCAGIIRLVLQMATQEMHLLRELIVGHGFSHVLSKLDGENVATHETLGPIAVSLALMRDMSEFVRDKRSARLATRVIAAVAKKDLVAECKCPCGWGA